MNLLQIYLIVFKKNLGLEINKITILRRKEIFFEYTKINTNILENKRIINLEILVYIEILSEFAVLLSPFSQWCISLT